MQRLQEERRKKEGLLEEDTMDQGLAEQQQQPRKRFSFGYITLQVL
jgi:hypothetical protein